MQRLIIMAWSHDEYIERLKADADHAYEIAGQARAKGFDPKIEAEIPQALLTQGLNEIHR